MNNWIIAHLAAGVIAYAICITAEEEENPDTKVELKHLILIFLGFYFLGAAIGHAYYKLLTAIRRLDANKE